MFLGIHYLHSEAFLGVGPLLLCFVMDHPPLLRGKYFLRIKLLLDELAGDSMFE